MQVVDKWRAAISETHDGLILVNKWLGRAALDIVTEGMLAHKAPFFDLESILTPADT